IDQPSRSTASTSSASSSRGTTSAIPRTELGVSPLDSPIPRLSKRMTRRALESRATNSGSQSSIVPRKRWHRSSGSLCGSPSIRTANDPSFVGIRVESPLVFQIICGLPGRCNRERTPYALTGGDLRRAPDNAPQSRKDESVYRHEVIAVVRRDATKHIVGVVKPSQQEVVTEIELLRLRVRRHVVRVGPLEDAPGFATFDVRLELTRGEARPGKEEGRCQIVPDRVAEKVGQVEAIPGLFAHMPRKGRARIGALFDDRAVTAFDPNPIGREDPPFIGFIA